MVKEQCDKEKSENQVLRASAHTMQAARLFPTERSAAAVGGFPWCREASVCCAGRMPHQTQLSAGGRRVG